MNSPRLATATQTTIGRNCEVLRHRRDLLRAFVLTPYLLTVGCVQRNPGSGIARWSDLAFGMTEREVQRVLGTGKPPASFDSSAVTEGSYLGALLRDIKVLDLNATAHFVFSKAEQKLVLVSVFVAVPEHKGAESDPQLLKELRLQDQSLYAQRLVNELTARYGRVVARTHRDDEPGYDDEHFTWLSTDMKVSLHCWRMGWLGGRFDITYEPIAPSGV